MDMIGHQTVAQHLYGVLATMVGQTGEISRSVVVCEENRFAPISTLRDVMRDAWCNGPCNPGHGRW
jgi:hypothetical protein